MEFIVNYRENLVVVAEKTKPTTKQLVLTYEDSEWWFFDCSTKESTMSLVEDTEALLAVIIAMSWDFIPISTFVELMHIMTEVMLQYDRVGEES